jgi:hypothetical protein
MAEHLVIARFFDVEDLAFERQNGLIAAIAPGFSGTAGRFAFDQEQFAAVWIAFLAIGQFAWQATGIERAFAAGQVARLACRFASAGRINRLTDDFLGNGRVLVEELAELFVNQLSYLARYVGIEFTFGLAFELRLGQFHANNSRETFADVVAGEIVFGVFDESAGSRSRVDRAGESAAKAAEMRSAVDGVDVVGEAENDFGILVVVLKGDFNKKLAIGDIALTFKVNRLIVERRFAAIQMFDEFGDTAAVEEFFGADVIAALIAEDDLEAAIQER